MSEETDPNSTPGAPQPPPPVAPKADLPDALKPREWLKPTILIALSFGVASGFWTLRKEIWPAAASGVSAPIGVSTGRCRTHEFRVGNAKWGTESGDDYVCEDGVYSLVVSNLLTPFPPHLKERHMAFKFRPNQGPIRICEVSCIEGQNSNETNLGCLLITGASELDCSNPEFVRATISPR